MTETPNSPDIQETRQEFQELPFEQVKRGDKIIVETHYKILKEDRFTTYEFDVQGTRKDGLHVKVEVIPKLGIGEQFLARLAGVVNQTSGKQFGVIKISQENDANNLYMQNIRDLNGNRRGKSMSTAAVTKITLVRKT